MRISAFRTQPLRGICFSRVSLFFYYFLLVWDYEKNKNISPEKVAIETRNGTEKIESLKEHLCKKRNIRLLKVPYKVGDDEAEFAGKIKKAFRSIHIFITSDETKDTEFIRKRFFEWRRKQNQNRRLSE